MKLIKTLLTILFISLLSSPSWSVSLYNLVEREDLFYQKFSNIPFTGETTGDIQGSIKNGMFEGAWVYYHDNGQLQAKVNYKNGKREGAIVVYFKSGQLRNKGTFKNGKREGPWVHYHDNGRLGSKGNYKNDKSEGAWVSYYENGQLKSKGNYKIDGIYSGYYGAWVFYNKDGTLNQLHTGTYKDGVKMSD